jgi:hypothetical protein
MYRLTSVLKEGSIRVSSGTILSFGTLALNNFQTRAARTLDDVAERQRKCLAASQAWADEKPDHEFVTLAPSGCHQPRLLRRRDDWWLLNGQPWSPDIGDVGCAPTSTRAPASEGFAGALPLRRAPTVFALSDKAFLPRTCR